MEGWQRVASAREETLVPRENKTTHLTPAGLLMEGHLAQKPGYQQFTPNPKRVPRIVGDPGRDASVPGTPPADPDAPGTPRTDPDGRRRRPGYMVAYFYDA